jgi:cysteine synthase
VHLLLKEDDLERELSYIANRVGASAIPPKLDVSLSAEFLRIYDAEVESAVRNVYRRDYMAFGFGDWGRA